jgi:hypothetical protein
MFVDDLKHVPREIKDMRHYYPKSIGIIELRSASKSWIAGEYTRTWFGWLAALCMNHHWRNTWNVKRDQGDRWKTLGLVCTACSDQQCSLQWKTINWFFVNMHICISLLHEQYTEQSSARVTPGISTVVPKTLHLGTALTAIRTQ